MKTLQWLIAVLAVQLVACVSAVERPDRLRADLEAMYDSDQTYRAKLQELSIKDSSATPLNSPEMRALWMKQAELDQANLKRLEEIVAASGWPDRRVVGDRAASAAFLVVQHAGYPAQKKYLPMLKAAVANGGARAQDLALLEDRILMAEGKKQLYGSQLRQDEKGGWQFYPIEDEANVDERRSAVGLSSLGEYAKEFGFEYKPSSLVRDQQESSELKPMPCSSEAALRSINGDQTTVIEFENEGKEPVDLVWLDYEGKRKHYGTISPGTTREQKTYVTHPWVIVSSAGQCIEIVVPTALRFRATIR